jgi:hypothetical protein
VSAASNGNASAAGGASASANGKSTRRAATIARGSIFNRSDKTAAARDGDSALQRTRSTWAVFRLRVSGSASACRRGGTGIPSVRAAGACGGFGARFCCWAVCPRQALRYCYRAHQVREATIVAGIRSRFYRGGFYWCSCCRQTWQSIRVYVVGQHCQKQDSSGPQTGRISSRLYAGACGNCDDHETIIATRRYSHRTQCWFRCGGCCVLRQRCRACGSCWSGLFYTTRAAASRSFAASFRGTLRRGITELHFVSVEHGLYVDRHHTTKEAVAVAGSTIELARARNAWKDITTTPFTNEHIKELIITVQTPRFSGTSATNGQDRAD